MRRVAVVGGRDGRLRLACEFGAAATLNYHAAGGDLAAAVSENLGRDFPIVIEASGSASAAAACLQLAAKCGRVLLLGDYADAHAHFRWNDVLLREIDLIGSDASAGAWPEAVQLAIGGRVPLDRLISHRLPAEKFAKGVELARSRRDDVLKVLLLWQ